MTKKKLTIIALIMTMLMTTLGLISASAAGGPTPITMADNPSPKSITKQGLQLNSTTYVPSKSSWSNQVTNGNKNSAIHWFVKAKETTYSNPLTLVFENCGNVMNMRTRVIVRVTSVKLGDYHSSSLDKYANKNGDVSFMHLDTNGNYNMLWAGSDAEYCKKYIYPGHMTVSYNIEVQDMATGQTIMYPFGFGARDLDREITGIGTIKEGITLGTEFGHYFRWPAYDLKNDGWKFYTDNNNSVNGNDSWRKKGFVAYSGTNAAKMYVTHHVGGDMATAVLPFKDWHSPGYIKVQKHSTNASWEKAPYTFAGIQYTIYDSNKSTAMRTVTLNAAGTSETVEMPPGTYYVKETKTNGWYKANTAWYGPYNVAGGGTITVPAKDDPNTGNFSSHKYVLPTEGSTIPDETAYLRNIKLTLRSNSNQISPVTINVGESINALTGQKSRLGADDAFAFNNLPFGTYTLTEDATSLTTASNAVTTTRGHFVSGQSMNNITVNVTANGTTMTYGGQQVSELVNYWDTDARLDLDVTKTMVDGSDPEGWHFELYSDENCSNLVASDVTDADGKMLFTDLPSQGTYYLKEVETDRSKTKFYKPKVNPMPVTVAKTVYNTVHVDHVPIATNTANFINEEKFVSLKIYKEDDSGNPLNNIEFILYDADNNEVARSKTRGIKGEDGVVIFDGAKNRIKAGIYTLEEVWDESKYLEPIWSEPQTFELDGDEVVKTFKVINPVPPPPGLYSLLIKKSSTVPLTETLEAYSFAGVTYKVYYDEDLTDLAGTVVLSRSGTGKFSIEDPDNPEYIDVWVVEDSTAGNYKLDDSVVQQVRLEKNATMEVDFEDEPELGSLEFDKVIECSDSDAEIPEKTRLTFTLQNIDAPSWTQSVDVPANGHVEFNDIPYGTYRLYESGLENYTIQDDGGVMLDSMGMQTIVIDSEVNHLNSDNEWTNFWVPTQEDTLLTVRKSVVDGYCEDYTQFRITITDAENNVVIDNQPLGSNGVFSTDTLKPGTYTLHEDLTANQLKVYEQPEDQTFTLVAGSEQELEVNLVNNTKSTQLIVYKKSSDGEIEGIRFSIHGETVDGQHYEDSAYTQLGELHGEPVGMVTFTGLKAGEYIVEETGYDSNKYTSNHIIAGYDNPAQEIEINGVDAEELTFINTPFEFHLTKTEVTELGEVTDRPVGYAEYTMFKLSEPGVYPASEDDVLALPGQVFTTDENGKIDAVGIERGSYLLYETASPEGYQNDRTIQPGYPINVGTAQNSTIGRYVGEITFDESNVVVTMTDTNPREPGRVIIDKVDDTGYPIGDTEFTLYSSNPNALLSNGTIATTIHGAECKGLTDRFGHLEFTDLAWGEYWLVETKPAIGYEKPENNGLIAQFTIGEEGGTSLDFEVVNTPKNPPVELVKVDGDTEQPIVRVDEDDRAMFELYTADNQLVRDHLITDENGLLHVEGLGWGSYYFKEVRAPQGYMLSSEPIRFTVNRFSAASATAQHLGKVKNYPATAALVVTVMIKEKSYWIDHGEPTFMATLTDVETGKKVNAPYTFDETFVRLNKDGEGYISKSITFDVDAYKDYHLYIHPADRWALEHDYRLGPIHTLAFDTAHDVDAATVDFNIPEGETGLATYVYYKDDWHEYGDKTAVTNMVRKEKLFTGLSVAYLGDAEHVEANMPFTPDLLSVYALFDDGSVRELTPAEYTVTDQQGNVLTRFPTETGDYIYNVTSTIKGTTRTSTFTVHVDPWKKVKVYMHTNGGTLEGDGTEACSIDGESVPYVEVWQYQTLSPSKYDSIQPPTGMILDDSTGNGWFKDSEFTTPMDTEEEITKDSHYFAKWKIAEYKINYFPSTPTNTVVTNVPAQQTKVHGVALTLSDQVPNINEGYEFLGWSTSQNGRQPSDVDYHPGDNYTGNTGLNLYAVWRPHTATLTYNANGGSLNGGDATATMSYETAAYARTTPTPQGPDAGTPFAYWSTDADDSPSGTRYGPGDLIKAANTEPTPTTLYAIYKNSPPIATMRAEHGSTITCTASDTGGIVSYYFGTSDNPSAGDFVSTEQTTSFSKDFPVTAEGTYYFAAKDDSGNVSDIKSITVKYLEVAIYQDGVKTTENPVATTTVNVNSGSEIVSNAPYYKELWPVGVVYNVTVPPTISDENSWEYKNLMPGSSPASGTTVDGGTSVQLNLTSKGTIHYDENLGDYPLLTVTDDTMPVDHQTMKYSDPLTLRSDVPLREGFTFTGWNTKADGTGTSYDPGDEYKGANSSALSKTLYAQWEQWHLGTNDTANNHVMTWALAEKIGNFGYAPTYFKEDMETVADDLSDDGQLTVTNEAKYTKAMTVDGTTAHAMIAGFNHDRLASGDGTAAITLMTVETLSAAPMYVEGEDPVGWSDSILRTNTLMDYLDSMDNDLKSRIKTVKKQSVMADGTVVDTNDKVFIPSVRELYGIYDYN